MLTSDLCGAVAGALLDDVEESGPRLLKAVQTSQGSPASLEQPGTPSQSQYLRTYMYIM